MLEIHILNIEDIKKNEDILINYIDPERKEKATPVFST